MIAAWMISIALIYYLTLPRYPFASARYQRFSARAADCRKLESRRLPKRENGWDMAVKVCIRWLDIDIQQSSKDIRVTIGLSAEDSLGKAFKDPKSVQFARTISHFHRLLLP
jgi:hypothetical protein